ncbi:MAG: sensor histidine kinase [Planctomycetota bacterium]
MKIDIEYMDTKRFDDEAHYANLYTLFRNKSRQEQYDIIITIDNNALLFLLNYRDKLYPNVPIVFCGVDCYHNSMYESRPSETTIEEILGEHDLVTGVLEEFDRQATVELALELHPSTRRVILVNDGINKTTYYPNLTEEEVADLIRKFAGRAEFQNLSLTKSNLDEILEEIHQHPEDSVVLLTNSFLDSKGRLSLLDGMLPTFWLRCEAPVYVVSRSVLEFGSPVGGYINSSHSQGKNAVDMTLRILSGESPSNIPITRKSPNMHIFKYPQMIKFGISPADLPPGSTILDQPESFYYRYKGRIWAVIAVIVSLAAMVAVLSANILRRKRAEENLRIRNIAIGSSINAIAFAGVEGNLTYVNHAFLEMWGYKNDRQVLGKPAVKFWQTEDDARRVIQTLGNNGRWMGELTARRKDGSTFEVQVSAGLVRDETERPVCMMASFVNITERKKTEEALIRGEHKYRTLCNNIPGMVYRAKTDWSAEIVAKSQDVCGYSAEQFNLGKISWLGIIHPDDKDRVFQEGSVLADRKATILQEYRIIAADGSTRWVEDHKTSFFTEDGSFEGVDGVVFDVTERKRAEEALREKEAHWRSLVESAPDIILMVDRDGRILFINRTVSSFAVEQTIGSSVYEYIPAEYHDLTRKSLEKVFETGDIVSFETQAAGPDGSICWYATRLGPIKHAGRVVAVTQISTDITDHKKAEEALRESEERYKALFDGAAEGLLVADIETKKFAYVNAAVCKMLGYTENELKQMGVSDIHPKEDLEHVIAEFEAQARREKTLASDIPCLRKDGKIVYADINTARIIVDGRRCNAGFFTDITERKLAEQARHASEEKYRRLVESLMQEYFFYSHGPDGVFNYISPSIANVLGYTQQEFLTHYTEYLTDNPVNDEVVRHTEQSIQGKQQSPYEVEIFHKNGSIHWLEVSEVPVFDAAEKVTAVEGIAYDITERKKAEETLRQSEEKYKSVVENIGIGVSLISPKMEILALNKQMKDWFPGIDMSKKPVCYRSFNLPAREHVCSYCPTVKSLKDGRVHEAITETPAEGRIVNYRIVASPIKDKNGEVTAAIEVVEDITERKKAQEELQKARDELEMRVEQRTADLAKAIKELRNEIGERKKAEKTLLVYQKQLRSLASQLSLAEERTRRRIATNVHDHIGQNLAISKIKLESLRQSAPSPEMSGSLDEIGDLIAQTIESSRSLTSELSPPVLYELGFEAAVEWLVRKARQQHGLQTDFKSDGRPKMLDHDVRVLLFQAVRELLVNVAKHARAHNVTVFSRRTAAEIMVTVEDDGIGFNTSQVRSRDYSTGGYGLFSIRERLGHIGGRVDIESGPKRGTKVTLVAPIDHGQGTNKK